MFGQLNGHSHILMKCENASVSVNSTKLLKLTWIKLDSEYQYTLNTWDCQVYISIHAYFILLNVWSPWSINFQLVIPQLLLNNWVQMASLHWIGTPMHWPSMVHNQNHFATFLLLIPHFTQATIILLVIIAGYVVLYVINDDNGVTLDRGWRDKNEYFPKPWEFSKDR